MPCRTLFTATRTGGNAQVQDVRVEAAEQVDVWLAAPSLGIQPAHTAATTLTRGELARVATMEPWRAAGFITGRLLLRAALAEHLGCTPREVLLDATCRCGEQHGPVRVRPSGPGVSVSRHGPLVTVALRVAGPVGVDLESVAAVGAAPLTHVLQAGTGGSPALVASPGQGGAYADAPLADVPLTRAWVRTEATLKMLGVGLRRDPADVLIDSHGVAYLDGAAVARVLDLPDDVPWPRPHHGSDLPSAAVGALALGGAAATRQGQEVAVRIHDGAQLLDGSGEAGETGGTDETDQRRS